MPDAHAIFASTQINENAIESEHDFRKHDERRRELHAIHGKTLEKTHGVNGTGQAGERELVDEFTDLIAKFTRRLPVLRASIVAKGFDSLHNGHAIAETDLGKK